MDEYISKTLRDVANQLIEDMINEIVSENAVASGNLKNSFKIFPIEDGVAIGNTSVSGEGYNYAQNVDLGRSSGKYAPIKPLIEWASLKGIVPKNNRSLKQFAFAVSHKLMERGYPGINFVAKSFIKSEDLITERLGEAYLKDLKEQLERRVPNLKPVK